MRALFATACLALALAGCRGTGSGMFGQITIPPPATQPPGTLLANNNYSPGSNLSVGSTPPAIAIPAARDSVSAPVLTPPADSPLTERRGASIARSSLGAPSRTGAPAVREEAIRIPDDSSTVGTLAAVVPIRGAPTTDVTSLFDTVRSQLTANSSVAVRPRASSGFVEISQLPDAPAALRRAALSGQSLR